MNLIDLKKYCLNKKATKEDFPFDDKTLVFKVGTKMFGLTNIENEVLSVNLKCDPELSISLRNEYSAIKPGYHMNKEHWNTVILDGSIEDDKIEWLIDLSYDLVVKGLPKNQRELLKK
ncbi:MAG: MmcQ/YjbR family DNA-binding protein [Clostridiaceae bacterium]